MVDLTSNHRNLLDSIAVNNGESETCHQFIIRPCDDPQYMESAGISIIRNMLLDSVSSAVVQPTQWLLTTKMMSFKEHILPRVAAELFPVYKRLCFVSVLRQSARIRRSLGQWPRFGPWVEPQFRPAQVV